MTSAVAIRHVCFEDMGTFAAVLSEHGVTLRYLEAGIDDLVCAPDLLIVLGGPIRAYEEDSYPGLSVPQLRADTASFGPVLETQGVKCFSNWLTGVGL